MKDKLRAIRREIEAFRIQLLGPKFSGFENVENVCPQCNHGWTTSERKDWMATGDIDRWLAGVYSLTTPDGMSLNVLMRRVVDRSAEGVEEIVLIDRAPNLGLTDERWGKILFQRFVTGRITHRSLSHGEWFHGHYFDELPEAVADFVKR